MLFISHGFQQLTNEFRHQYSQFWLSILNADKDGIMESADKLGVGQLYGLFACMVTGRSWSSILKGIDRAEKNAAESKEIKSNAARYLKEITDVLAFVNRQMILIFKTNDLLRNIEHSLGTQNRFVKDKVIVVVNFVVNAVVTFSAWHPSSKCPGPASG